MRETAFLLAAALVAASAAEPLPALANLPAQPGAAVVYLLTFPGSGNTWVRHLIQEGTRVYAGSQYHAHQLEENGFPSDALGAGAYARLSVVKSHGAFFEKEALYGATHGHARVVVLRHPCAALVSEFRRMTWKAHAGDASAQQRAQGREGQTFFFEFDEADRSWAFFLRVTLPKWVAFSRDVDAEPRATPALRVYYEDLAADLGGALARVFAFLVAAKPSLASRAPAGANATRWMVQNALRDAEGGFHRPHPEGGERRHWSPAQVAEACAVFAPWWGAEATRWWGVCNETCR